MRMVLISPPFTQEQYEKTLELLTGGKNRVNSAADWPVDGLLAHIAGQGRETFRVVDVWESEEALDRFAEIIGPILREAGVEGEPEVYPAHTYISR